jgi:hypothetical protein
LLHGQILTRLGPRPMVENECGTRERRCEHGTAEKILRP